MRRLIRQPLLHFLALGAFLLAVQRLLLPPPALPYDDTPVRVTAADVERLRADWQRDSGRAPSAAELRASIARHVDEVLLLREALRLELDLRDAVARERLLRNMRFAFPQRRAADATLLHEARALGMSAHDPVVRRRLVQMMERRLTAEVPYDAAALRAYVAAQVQGRDGGMRYAFRHVFLATDRPRADARAQALALRAQLVAGSVDAQAAGDPFLHGAVFAALSAREIAARFGADFAGALARLPPGTWSDPLASPYGLHLVRVQTRTPAPAADAQGLSAQLLAGWIEQRRAALLREQLAQLRTRYRIEAPPPDGVGSGA